MDDNSEGQDRSVNAYLTLYLDLTELAADGAGWYIGASLDGQQVMTPVAIEPDAALKLSMAIQSTIEGSESEIPSPSPAQIVLSGNGLIRSALQAQLDYAENQARKVAKLKRRLKYTTDPSARVDQPEPRIENAQD
jgi:hypothetical protein